ncbi:glycosyltransferase involved in cell wall biosynthesis [Actinomadura algeriensis]|uniref:Glycosyltransferase involved in cell wall biosynthesis n=1 Tax=Actinomadura algeriensis TaxID=1679523 RepID=A0ABR9JNQ7_9ACTN|nr:glycosyltransferase involved in cell wall biosynthesis [Actinomadura algeriensis]
MPPPTPSSPLRVLHVSQPTSGGVAVYVGAAAGDQRRRGWEVAVACPPDGDLPGRCTAAGVPWFNWDAGRAPGPAAPREALALRRLVAGFRPDVVHLHSSKAGLAGRLPRLPRRTPVIFQPHGWSWLAATGRQRALSLAWERLAARRAAALVCVGAGELGEGVQAGVRGAYRLVRNGVDRRRFVLATDAGRAAARARLGVPPGAPLAVCVGRLTRQKGQDVLVAAWPEVLARCPDARLAIVGDGEDLEGLRGAGARNVRFVPAVADPRDWFAAADVVALPSRWEGLPLTALEAMATGRPIIGTRVPGLSEIVRPGTGALVPPDEPAPLAAELATRLLVPGIAEKEGREAAEVAADYDLAGTLDSLATVTRGVADCAPGPVPDDGRSVAGGVEALLGDGFGFGLAGAGTPPNSSR